MHMLTNICIPTCEYINTYIHDTFNISDSTLRLSAVSLSGPRWPRRWILVPGAGLSRRQGHVCVAEDVRAPDATGDVRV